MHGPLIGVPKLHVFSLGVLIIDARLLHLLVVEWSLCLKLLFMSIAPPPLLLLHITTIHEQSRHKHTLHGNIMKNRYVHTRAHTHLRHNNQHNSNSNQNNHNK